MPYVTLNSHLNLVNNEGVPGTFYTNIYLPIASGTGGATNVGFTWFLSMHDVELVTPAVPFAVTQSSGPN